MMISHKVAQEGEKYYHTSFKLRGESQDFFNQRTSEMTMNVNQSCYQSGSILSPNMTSPSSLI